MGCAGLGQDYPPGTSGVYGDEAIQLIHTALEAGINVFDTSPRYGDSEALVSKALNLKQDEFSAAILTKFDPEDYEQASRSINRLKRVPLYWQATPRTQQGRALVCRLGEIRARVTFNSWISEVDVNIGVGYSVHEEMEAAAAATLGLDQLQIPFNVHDQRFRPFLQLRDRLAIFTRSPLLRGTIHDDLRALRFAFFGYSEEECPTSVFLGIKSEKEIFRALEALGAGRLEDDEIEDIYTARCRDLDAIEPRRWDGYVPS